MTLVAISGLIGTVAFLLSALPQAILSLRQGHARGVSGGTLALRLTGEVCCAVYAAGALNWDAFLLANYLGNAAVVGLIAWLKLFPRTTQ